MTEGIKDASALYEVERRAQYGARPGFHITELQISPSQKVPWHYHNNIHDTFYVVEGSLRIFLQQPKKRCGWHEGRPFPCHPSARTSSPMAAKRQRCFWCCRESATTTSCR
jgi:hypothetical protein